VPTLATQHQSSHDEFLHRPTVTASQHHDAEPAWCWWLVITALTPIVTRKITGSGIVTASHINNRFNMSDRPVMIDSCYLSILV